MLVRGRLYPICGTFQINLVQVFRIVPEIASKVRHRQQLQFRLADSKILPLRLFSNSSYLLSLT